MLQVVLAPLLAPAHPGEGAGAAGGPAAALPLLLKVLQRIMGTEDRTVRHEGFTLHKNQCLTCAHIKGRGGLPHPKRLGINSLLP
jgi:hypothetical protein